MPGLGNKKLYNGKDLVDDFGLNWYHYGARWYDPQLGRWTTMDPADEFHSPYVYGPNDPINGTDFGGMFWEELWNSICGKGWNTDVEVAINNYASHQYAIVLDPVEITETRINWNEVPYKWMDNLNPLTSEMAGANPKLHEPLIDPTMLLAGGLSGLVRASTSVTGTIGYRYMSQAELNAIRTGPGAGFLRGGREGATYFTKDLFKSGAKAQSRLSLGSKPALRVEFEILNNPTLLRNGTKVVPGGGSEFMTLDPVKVKLINWQPLR